MYGKGARVEKDTFIQQNGPEKGVVHHFADKEEIEKLLKDFKLVNIELRERKSDDYLQSRWIVIASSTRKL